MRLGIATPVVTNVVGAHAKWEVTGTIEDVARVAETADRLGYDHLTCSEHIGLPETAAAQRGARYWDPLATFGYVAARTSRIRLATNVLVLGYHHPLEIVKRYGTLDQVSGGRVILGVGVGTLKEEFELLGAPFADRGARADDALKALRACLSTNSPSYHGDYYSIGDLRVDPCALQGRVPLWVGGRSFRSLRRATTLADGWCPFGVTLETAREWLGRLVPAAGFDLVLPPERPLDPIGDAAATESALRRFEDGGVTCLQARFVHRSLSHYLEQLEALAELNRAVTR